MNTTDIAQIVYPVFPRRGGPSAELIADIQRLTRYDTDRARRVAEIVEPHGVCKVLGSDAFYDLSRAERVDVMQYVFLALAEKETSHVV